jgi:hypothetical protein
MYDFWYDFSADKEADCIFQSESSQNKTSLLRSESNLKMGRESLQRAYTPTVQYPAYGTTMFHTFEQPQPLYIQYRMVEIRRYDKMTELALGTPSRESTRNSRGNVCSRLIHQALKSTTYCSGSLQIFLVSIETMSYVAMVLTL